MKPNVLIVGAGPAGIGLAVTLRDFKVPNVVVLDRHEIGASFNRWPKEMRLITPSFNSTPFGILDLNAIALNTSVANYLGNEHPTGSEYAQYLRAVAKACELQVQTGVEITDVDFGGEAGFFLETSRGRMSADFVIWAAGEFQFPKPNGFDGSELCLHSGTISSFRDLPGQERVIIGAFESGVDAAVHLAQRGIQVTLINAAPELVTTDQDPSRSLSPFTRTRLETVCRTRNNLRVAHNCRVMVVAKTRGKYVVRFDDGDSVHSDHPPIMATGFRGGIGPVEHLFDFRDDGEILLTGDDESTRARGLFLAGPLVRHERHIFCYIYKFRQRFAVIAESIAERLGIKVPDELLEFYERNQMRLVDLSCCGGECVC